MKIKETYQNNMDIIYEYPKKYPKQSNLINAFVEMRESSNEHKRTKLTICIGKTKEKGFEVYLKSKIENPKIKFLMYGDEEVPQIIIADRLETIAVFTLDDIHMISENIGEDDGSLFTKHDFKICIDDKFDYKIIMTIYKD